MRMWGKVNTALRNDLRLVFCLHSPHPEAQSPHQGTCACVHGAQKRRNITLVQVRLHARFSAQLILYKLMSAGKAAIFGNASQRHMLCSVMDACCSPYMIYEGASFLFGVATVTVDQHLEQTRCRCCFAPFTHNICVISIPVHYTLYIVVGCACVAVYGGTSGGRMLPKCQHMSREDYTYSW